jgi:hypothetical protein
VVGKKEKEGRLVVGEIDVVFVFGGLFFFLVSGGERERERERRG